MAVEGILSLPTHVSLDSLPSSDGFLSYCHAEMAEPLDSPNEMLRIAEYRLGNKAATATWLHDS